MAKGIDDLILAELGQAATEPARITARGAPAEAALAEPEFGGTDRFEILRRIGEGGMGVVYEARDRSSGSSVALKTLRHLDADALLRFKTEFRALQDTSHENLVRLGELFEHAGTWFFSMELVAGSDLLSHIRANNISRGFDEDRLRSALCSLAEAIGALHSAGFVHRDVKPANVRVAPAGRVVLLDFGLIAETAGPRDSLDGTVVGTAAYMAPEQTISQRVGPEADWYSLGVILFEVLTGELPFDGTPAEILANKRLHAAPDPMTLAPDVPPDLAALAGDLLATAPEQRPPRDAILAGLGRSGKASPPVNRARSADVPFVGRDPEFAELRSAYADCRKGSAITVYVHGESGLGKSALIREFTQQLRADCDDILVLAGRCYERESVPYKAFDGIVDALCRHLAARPAAEITKLIPPRAALLSRIFPVLARVGAIADASSASNSVNDPQELRDQMFGALRQLLGRLAEERPVVVVIDDLQWSDADSSLLLADLMRPPGAPRVLLLISSRQRSHSIRHNIPTLLETRETAELGIPGEVRRVSVSALDPEPARALATMLLQRLDAHPEQAAAIAHEAGGHPMFIDELVRDRALKGPRDGAQLSLDGVIWKRVVALPSATREILQLVSVAAAPISPEVVRGAAGLEASTFEKHAAALRNANLVLSRKRTRGARLEPYHDRIREAVVQHLDPSSLRQCNAALAESLEANREASIRPELLLRHLAAAGQEQRAARYAAAAARIAADALAFDRATELYRAALRLGSPGEAERRELLTALAQSLADAGRGTSSADAYLEAAQGAEPAVARACRVNAAQQLLITGHIDRGLTTLRGVLEEMGERQPANQRGALLSLLWQRLKLRTRGLGWQERPAGDQSVSDQARADLYIVAGDGLGMVDPILGMSFHTRHLLLALKLGERQRIARALAVEAVFSATGGHSATSRVKQIMAEVGRLASESQDPYLQAMDSLGNGIVDYMTGSFVSASVRLKHAEGTLRAQSASSIFEINNARLIRLLALAHAGEFRTMVGLFERYVRDAERRGDNYVQTSLRRACSYVYFAADVPDQARIALELTSWAPPKGSYHLQHYYGYLGRTLLSLYVGSIPEDIDRLREDHDAFLRSNVIRVPMVRIMGHSMWGRAMAALAQRSGHEKTASREAARAARLLEREGYVFADAYAALLRAAVAKLAGRTDDSIAALERAVAKSQECSMAYATAAAQQRLGELVGGDEGSVWLKRAQTWAEQQRIVNQGRMFEMLAPGFS